MHDLSNQSCRPCQSGALPIKPTETSKWLQQLPEWQLVTTDAVPRLSRCFQFKNFRQAMRFSIRVGELAETEQHHPQLITEWGKVTVSWWTHKIGGLHQNDFIMAAKTAQLFTAD